MSELSKRIRSLAGWIESDGWNGRAEDLRAAADIVEAAEWRLIEPEKMERDTAVLCGNWATMRSGAREWVISAQRHTPHFAKDLGFTHYLPIIPAAPEVQP